METIYLRGDSHNHYSEEVDLDKYFKDYAKAVVNMSGTRNKSLYSILQTILPENISLNKREFKDLLRSTNPNILKPVTSTIAKRKNANSLITSKRRYLRKAPGVTTPKLSKSQTKYSLRTKKSFTQNEGNGVNMSVSDDVAVDTQSEALHSTAENEDMMLRNAEHHTPDPASSPNGLDEIKTSKLFTENDKVVCEDFEFVSVDKMHVKDNIDPSKKQRTERPSYPICIEYPLTGRNKTTQSNLTKLEDFLVSFQIYDPFHCQDGGTVQKNVPQEILVLSHQTLGNLRDKIICTSDFQDLQGDLSKAPDTPVKRFTRDVYKSAMFYFNNTFYVDYRQHGSEDYSKVIRDWALPRGIRVGSTFDMELKRVGQLRVRFGYPYVYMHQGCCEHLVVINDARLLNRKYSLHSRDYPMMIKSRRWYHQQCYTCHNAPAWWLVVNNDRLPYDITHMCKTCFKMFNYIDNEKCGNFKAYRIFQKAVLV